LNGTNYEEKAKHKIFNNAGHYAQLPVRYIDRQRTAVVTL
jgi:hypothetical protein